MAYSFQTFSVLEVLGASKMNQIEVNIRDHVHGQDSVSDPILGPTPRQTVLTGAKNSSGDPAFFAAGTGLALNLSATATALVLAFAAGFSTYGPSDKYSVVSADASSFVSSLPASNTSYVSVDYSSASAVTWGKYLVPPDYGKDFDQTRGSILNFEGADTSTTILDDFGNVWACGGNAQIDTAQFKFGASSGLLDGTGDYFENTTIPGLGDYSAEMTLWFRINNNPSSGNRMYLLSFTNAAGLGVIVNLFNNSGTIKLEMSLSSDGATHDIASGTVGSNTTWTTGQWNRIRWAFDALLGTYKCYLSLNGAAETADISVSSTSRICALGKNRIGIYANGSGGFDGWVDGFRLVRCLTSNATATPGASAPAISDYPYHWFDTQAYKMYEATAASASAGTDPTLTARNRVFVGEADTDGSGVTAVRNYAYKGYYDSGLVANPPAANTVVSFSHNVGTFHVVTEPYLECITTSLGYTPGMRTVMFGEQSGVGPNPLFGSPTTRNTADWVTGNNSNFISARTGAGDPCSINSVASSTGWKYGMRVRRAF